MIEAARAKRRTSTRATRTKGVGVDAIDVDRFSRFVKRHPARLCQLFTTRELSYSRRQRRPAESLAARFAAKEAFLKSLGSLAGFSFDWREVEVVVATRGGPPSIVLRGRARAEARRVGVSKAWVSMSHTRALAVALVTLEQNTPWSARSECGS